MSLMLVKPMLTAERLKDILRYNPETGLWTWLVSTGRRVRVNDNAGSLNNCGYISIRIEGKAYLAHRLAWLYMTGDWPPYGIDHKDTIRNNNKWDNLRLATNHENQGNQLRPKTNTSGVKGVHWDKQKKKWSARIGIEGKRIFLGLFDDLEKAATAYESAAIKYFGEFARPA